VSMLDALPADLTVPLSIFLAEMCVVTLGTLRVIFVSRGKKYLAPALGFFEIMIWLFAITQVMQNLTSPSCFIAFAAGFTLGNYLGILIEEKLALGNLVIRAITTRDPAELVERLKSEQYGVTCLDGQGAYGPVRVLLTVIKRRELGKVVGLIKHFDPKTFYSVDDIQSTAEGVFPAPRALHPPVMRQLFRMMRVAG
jgi:uncharacterized protein YebE (UPF0316 family)